MSDGDTVQALNHPYRRRILQVLQSERMTYTDLFNCLEPDGGDRARFNYHLRSVRKADLVQLEGKQYRLTYRGRAALTLLRGVSESPEPRADMTQESREGRGRWATRVARVLGVQEGRTLGLLGGIAVVVGTLLPWSEKNWTGWGPHALPGIMLVGGVLTLAFGVAGLIASTMTEGRAKTLGGVFGAMAMVWVVLTFVSGVSGFALALFGEPVGMIHAVLGPATPQFGLLVSLVGASMLVLGASWTRRSGSGRVESSTRSDRMDRASEQEATLVELDSKFEHRTTLRPVAPSS